VQIAIDGPSGSGKSTVAKLLAGRLGFVHIDTGGMYRAVALYAQEQGADWDVQDAVCGILNDIEIDIQYAESGQRIVLNGRDVTAQVRTAEMGVGASKVSVHPAVRDKLVAMQRELAAGRSVIMDGRDVGTVVLADADVKIFLTAAVDVRARRRCSELDALGLPYDYDEIYKQIERRDYDDSTREHSPLTMAADAVELDAGGLDAEGVVAVIMEMVRKCSLYTRE